MKNIIKRSIYPLMLGFMIVLFNGCEKDEEGQLPIVETNALYNLTSIGAFCEGNITSDGGAKITNRGFCWSLDSSSAIVSNPTSAGMGKGYFTVKMFGLNPRTTYYVRAFASNRVGTTYSEVMMFKTPGDEIVFNPSKTYGTVTDVDNNTYKTIKIGNQTWMAENLKVITYNDSVAIPLFSDDMGWRNREAFNLPVYCGTYNNVLAFKDIYGAYYNWNVVNTGKLCPTGWHVPSENEWQALCNYLGGAGVAGSKLKETGSNHWWYNQSAEATNESGFTALPGGGGLGSGSFTSIGGYGYWWSSTMTADSNAVKFNIYCSDDGVFRYEINPRYGFSVRCIKDSQEE